MTTAYTSTISGLSGLEPGTWSVDPIHSEVAFSVRHMMVGKVRGRFTAFDGEITAAQDGSATVNANVQVASVETQNAQRDEHIRSADFFDAATHPTMSFRSTGLRAHDGKTYLDGDLTLHGVTRPVTFELEVGGVALDPYGNLRAGFTATTEIARKDFGISIQMPMDGGGVVVGDKVKIDLEVEAVRQAS
jgi:polyisoprenoid-binding protein YceI